MIFSLKTFTMKTIKFNESELEFLKNHYELELMDAENYVGEIKNILKKLGVSERDAPKDKPVKSSAKKRGRPKNEKKPVAEVASAPALKPVKKEPVKKAVKKVTKKAAKKVPPKTVKPKAVVVPAQPAPAKTE
jgi:hypothetical protein